MLLGMIAEEALAYVLYLLEEGIAWWNAREVCGSLLIKDGTDNYAASSFLQ